MLEDAFSIRGNPNRRWQAFWSCLCGGILLVILSVYDILHYSSKNHLAQVSGEVLRVVFREFPRTKEIGSEDRFDLYVFLKGHRDPVTFRSFDREETKRISEAILPGQFAELDIDPDTRLIWGVTSDNVMYLSPSHTRSEKKKALYSLIGMGLVMLFVAIIIWALPDRRNPHGHYL